MGNKNKFSESPLPEKEEDFLEDVEDAKDVIEAEVVDELMSEEVEAEVDTEFYPVIHQDGELLILEQPKKMGLFLVNWVETRLVCVTGIEKIFNSIHAGTIIHDQEEIERLKSIGAPIKVYIEYVD